MGSGRGQIKRVLNESAKEQTLRINATTEIPLSEFSLRMSRSSGPGGQNVNKLATKVQVSFNISDSLWLSSKQKEILIEKLGEVVTVTAQDTQSQLKNRELALSRLREKLAAALFKPKARRKTRISASTKAKRLDEKRQLGEKKKQRQRPHYEH